MEIVADLHMHTLASGHAYNTIGEMVASARAKGIEIIALTEHGPDLPGAPHMYYFKNMVILPSKIGDVEILRGVEANIMNWEGGLDVPNNVLEKLDIVLAGFHDDCIAPGNVEENTRAMLNIIQHPLVNVIVHPGNPRFNVDYDKIVSAARENHVAIEVNNSSLTVVREGSLENCREIVKRCKKYGTMISLGSDAHWSGLVGEFTKAMALITEAGIEEQQILNTSAKGIKEFLKNKH